MFFLKSNALIGALLFVYTGHSQTTFNKTFEYDFHTVFVNVWQSAEQYYTCGLLQDSTGINYSLVFAKYDAQGNELLYKIYDSPDTLWWTNDDCNLILDSIFLVAVHGYTVDDEYCTLIWFNQLGDTLQTRSFASPYADSGSLQNDFMSVRSIDNDSQGNIYTSCQIFQDDGTANDFILTKFNTQGDSLWSYLVHESGSEYCFDIQAMEDGVLIGGGGVNDNSSQTFIKLNVDGEWQWQFDVDEGSLPLNIPNEIIVEEDGIVVACEYTYDGVFYRLPAIIKTSFDGTILWSVLLPGNEDFFQYNNHLAKSQDGGYLAAAWQYEENPPNPDTNGNYNWNAWLIKVSQQGELEWERFYHFIESPFDKHRVYDLKATSDGGFIFCGDAIDNNVDVNGEVIQRGWLVKVDGCGCLVPGCDEDCVVGIEESGLQEPGYFKVGPNPATQFLNIYLAQDPRPSTQYQFQLHGINGKLVKEFTPRTSNTTYMMDVEKYENGTYVLSLVVDGTMVQSETILKQ